jgi:hypothetical protein
MASNTDKTPAQIQAEYEKQLAATEKQVEAKIMQLYTNLINQITPLAASQKLPPGIFTLDKLSVLNNRLDTLLDTLTANVDILVRSGVNSSWKLSNEKNDLLADIRLEKTIISAGKQATYYDTNVSALKAYTDQQINGLNLSDRIYKAADTFKAELEAGLGLGISQGQSAAEMGRDLRQYLKEPDKLFRRVKDVEGNFQLSKNAAAYHPGQGVYRSSTANIERLTRTTINGAYRQADNTRWQQMPFVLGQTIHTSGSHPKYDICDEMKGDYPVEFVFIGWHPQCLCFTVPKLMNDNQFKQYQQLVVTGKDSPENVGKIARPVVEIPDGASNWMDNNKDRVAGWKNPPSWWNQNSNYTPDLKGKF